MTNIKEKILIYNQKNSLNKLKKNFYQKKIVFTNGCFDLIHKGHIDYLQLSKNLGDILVVGLNSDISVKKNKGPKRPICDMNSRSFVLASLYMVDYVVIFNEITPENLIKDLKPDVLVKGKDYKKGDFTKNLLLEKKTVEKNNGNLFFTETNIMSSTKIINNFFSIWDKEQKKCFAGFTVSGSNVGVNETVTVSGEVLNFLSTGIDTRVYFIKNF